MTAPFTCAATSFRHQPSSVRRAPRSTACFCQETPSQNDGWNSTIDYKPLASIGCDDMLSQIFLSGRSLRTGWSVLLFVAIFEVVEIGATTVLRQFVSLKPLGPIPLSLAFSRECRELFAVAVATWVMSRIEKRRLFSYGLEGSNKVSRLSVGALWGFLALSALLGILWKAGAVVFRGKLLNGVAAWEYGLGWLFVFLVVGLFEESLLRGYLQYRLTRTIGFWWAAIGLSIAFSLMHLGNHDESTLGLLSLVAGGLVFCISLWYTNSLWWAVGFHAGWDWGESYFYGTPNSGLIMQGHLLSEHPAGHPLWSGGSTGPEASVLLLPLFIVAGFAMLIWWRKKSGAFNPGQQTRDL